jgi:hypothetical protein
VLGLPPLATRDTAELEEANLTFQADRPVPATMATLGVGLRLTMDIGAGLFIGIDGELGAATRAAPVRVMTDSSEPVVASQSRYGQLGLLVGARRALGRSQLTVELAGGVQAIPITARYADDMESGGEHTASFSRLVRPVLEPRLRFDRWLTPWISVGAFVGAQIPVTSNNRGYAGGLQLSLHVRAFDGGL